MYKDTKFGTAVLLEASRAIVNVICGSEVFGGKPIREAVICGVGEKSPSDSRTDMVVLASFPGQNGEEQLCFSPDLPELQKPRPVVGEKPLAVPQLWTRNASTKKVLKRIDWKYSAANFLESAKVDRDDGDRKALRDPEADLVLDEAGRAHSRYILLRRSRYKQWGKRAGRRKTLLVLMDLEVGCEAAVFASQYSDWPELSCARLIHGGERLRVAAGAHRYAYVWDVEVSALRTNPVGPLPVLYPARRISEAMHEIFEGCLIDGRTSCSPELRAVLLEKGAHESGAEGGEAALETPAAGAGPVEIALRPWAAAEEAGAAKGEDPLMVSAAAAASASGP
eukprot:tig00021179_g19245.t1